MFSDGRYIRIAYGACRIACRVYGQAHGGKRGDNAEIFRRL